MIAAEQQQTAAATTSTITSGHHSSVYNRTQAGNLEPMCAVCEDQ